MSSRKAKRARASRKATGRSPFRWRDSVSARRDGIEDGEYQEVQHRLTERSSTTLLPFSAEPTKAEMELSMVGAYEKTVTSELTHGAGKRFESDATRLSSSQKAVSCALNNVLAQQGLHVFAQPTIPSHT